MKKFIAILMVALLVAGAVFAATENHSVTVKSVVGKVTLKDANDEAGSNSRPLFQLFVVDKGSNTNEHTSAADISQANVVADFVIVQNELVRTDESITLSVSANPLSMTDAEGTHSTANPVLDNVVKNKTVGSDSLNVVETKNGKDLSLALTYGGASKEVPAGAIVCEFQGTWTKKAELASHNGTYSATITLTYTIN